MHVRKNMEMDSQDDVLSFLDMLDLDEEFVDLRLKTIMSRQNYTDKHISHAIQLLKYKQLITFQEGTECENDKECDFLVRLFCNLNSENVDKVCIIAKIILSLNTKSIARKSEHLLQQILSNVEFPVDNSEYTSENLLNQLKFCDSILDAVSISKEELSLAFLETPLEGIVDASNELLQNHFLTHTVPKLFDNVTGFNIIDRIWNYIKHLKNEKRETALSILSVLSDFYLPVGSEGNTKIKSDVLFQSEFWDLILFGLSSDKSIIRKTSLYLSKRAIDCLLLVNRNVNIVIQDVSILLWKYKNKISLKNMWDGYFILIDSLEEKQSNIVLPSLQLFKTLKHIDPPFLNCVFKLGLKHENALVKLKCIEYKLNTKKCNKYEAVILMEALNDIMFFDEPNDYNILKHKISELLQDSISFLEILTVMPSIKWSPVPLYHVTDVMSTVRHPDLLENIKCEDFSKLVNEILKVPCNLVAIRKAIHINIINFVRNHNVPLPELLNMYGLFQNFIGKDENKFYFLTAELIVESVKSCDKIDFIKKITNSHLYVEIIYVYLNKHPEDMTTITDLLYDKCRKIENVVSRQYSDKGECLYDVLFTMDLYMETLTGDSLMNNINSLIVKEQHLILQFVLCLLTDDILTNDTSFLLKIVNSLTHIKANENVTYLINLYKIALLLLKDKNTHIHKKLLSIFTINSLNDNLILLGHYKHEMLTLDSFLDLLSESESKNDDNAKTGRLTNMYYEKVSEIVYSLIKCCDEKKINLISVIRFIDNITECGGYGCLKWILKITNVILETLLINKDIDFNVIQFMNRMWNEIEEVKSNNQYTSCIEEFVKLITQNALLEKSVYNNIVISYCNKIIEYGPSKNLPLYYLVQQLNYSKISSHSQMAIVFCEILLYTVVSRKDQRIAENLVIELKCNPKYASDIKGYDAHFNYEIKYLSLLTLFKIKDPEILQVIITFITEKVKDLFKTKQRYHGNSQIHRILLTALQHLLLLTIKKILDVDKIVIWCAQLLGKLPHQTSVKFCLEWNIALALYLKKKKINDDIINILKAFNVPTISQFFILYWLLKHKIKTKIHSNDEFEYVMDTLLSHTMGQMFHVRLHAQYLVTKLHTAAKHNNKYDYVIEIIEKTLKESSQDKNLLKIQADYYVNDFDIISHIDPFFIYHTMPRQCDVRTNELVDIKFVKDVTENIKDALLECNVDEDFKGELAQYKFDNSIDFKFVTNETSVHSDTESLGTIQKKYIPWRNMSGINVYDTSKKKPSASNLIVVASLINKLPNLGGMARTSEVFGVKTYVIDSLRHLQDRVFQGLSVSAERWIDVEEVRPGKPLKEYLMRRKSEGYAVVAAEQTSTSVKLQNFKFPTKTLLLLGHEKEGIPCDLFPLMDHCVEIPQQGYVRSLNVHVTAAIFVWEYARQNLL